MSVCVFPRTARIHRRHGSTNTPTTTTHSTTHAAVQTSIRDTTKLILLVPRAEALALAPDPLPLHAYARDIAILHCHRLTSTCHHMFLGVPRAETLALAPHPLPHIRLRICIRTGDKALCWT